MSAVHDAVALTKSLYVSGDLSHDQYVGILAGFDLYAELFDDCVRWRESGGDTRDQSYILETMTKIEACAGFGTVVHGLGGEDEQA